MSLTCPTAHHFLGQPQAPRLSPLDLVVIGLNHQTAPVAVREQAAVHPDEEARILEHLARSAREVMLLSTCNRTEVYLAGLRSDPVRAFESVWGEGLRGHLYLHHAEQAAQHLYRVTAGLDSQVIGETQIQGQVKRAWQVASQHGLTLHLLNKVAQGALACGKRVRTETGMSDKVVSVSSAAVELARTWLGDLQERAALIIGAGETAELTLTHLRSAGVRQVMVVNRSRERAQQLAARLGGQAHGLSDLVSVLPVADVVIASSAAPHYVLHALDVAQALQVRQQQPMMLIDISVPRILAPEIADVPGAYLQNLDDLQGVVSRNLQSRRAALPHAQAIMREGVADLNRWHYTRQAQHERRELLLASD